MSEIAKTSAAVFQNDVLNAALPVLVDFTAVWCGPCKMLEPSVKQLADEWSGRARVFKLDVDEIPDLAMQYQVMGVPTLMLFVKGRPVERVTGFQPKDRIAARFAPHIR